MEAGRKYFVGGNWKCNGSVNKNKDLINDVINKLEFDTQKVGKIDSIIVFHCFITHQ